MHTTPSSLLLRLKQSDAETAWRRFVDLYTPLLFYWARHAGLRSPDDADVVQEVFALLVQKLPDFEYDPRRSFRGWLHTVMRNRLCELQRRCSVPRGGDDDHIANLPAPVANDLGEEEHRRLLVSRAAHIMQSDFEETTWRACWETTANGRRAADVAQMLGISENAVYVAKGRVLRRLRKELEGLM
jgi:RNA polymerase sigma-70 factor, ECF subfamily